MRSEQIAQPLRLVVHAPNRARFPSNFHAISCVNFQFVDNLLRSLGRVGSLKNWTAYDNVIGARQHRLARSRYALLVEKFRSRWPNARRNYDEVSLLHSGANNTDLAW